MTIPGEITNTLGTVQLSSEQTHDIWLDRASKIAEWVDVLDFAHQKIRNVCDTRERSNGLL